MQSGRKSADKPVTLSHSTVKRRMAVLSAALSQAVRWNLIASNLMDRVQILKKESAAKSDKTMCFTQEQAEAFLNALENPLLYQYNTRKRADSAGKVYSVQEYQSEHSIHLQLKLFFYLAMFTGCRRGELIALEWSDIDFAAASVHITKSTSRVSGEVITKSTKTKGSVREISVPTAVIELAKNGKQSRKPSDPELPLIPLHGLRHTAATLLISQGVDIRTVSGKLGHSNTSTTLNIYAEFLKEMDRSASDKLENLLIKDAK